MVRSAKYLALALVLCLVFVALAGCRQSLPQPTEPEDPPLDALMAFPGIRWTMRPQEVMDTLGLTEADCEITETPYDDSTTPKQNGNYTIGFRNLEVFGQEAVGAFTFMDYTGDGKFYLDSIQVNFPEGTDIPALRTTMAEAYGESTPKPTKSAERDTWSSDALVANCFKKDVFAEAASSTVTNVGKAKPELTADFLTTPLVTVRLDCLKDGVEDHPYLGKISPYMLTYQSAISSLIQYFDVAPEFFQ